MVDSERASLERQLDRRRRNLCKLQEKAAIYAAGEVPLHLQNQIEAEQEAIADIEAKLDSIPVKEDEDRRKPGIRIRVDWWASLDVKYKVMIFVALIGVFGSVVVALLPPFAEELVGILFPSPTPTPTATASPTPTSTPTSTPTLTPTPTPPCPIPIHDALTYPNGGASLEVIRGAGPTRPDVVRITFENPYPDSFSSWVVLLDTCDAAESDSLSFWVRGATGGEQFVVGIKDLYTSSSDEPKVQRTAPADWQRVSIPLRQFQKIKEQDLSSLENVSLGFTYALGSGTIYVDEFIIGPP